MLLSTIRTPLEEEGDTTGEGAAVLEQLERGPIEGEGTSIDMPGSFRNCGLRSVISWSFRNSILDAFSIIIMICAAYLSVFFAPARYMEVKIARSYSEVVSQTTKHTMIYPGSGPSLEVIALCPEV
jgi:hypothetical protein